MKFNFKRIASVLTSTVMLSSTLALAAAANYPDPFIKAGNPNVAVVYGSNAVFGDSLAVADITQSLQVELSKQTGGSSGGISGSSSNVVGGDYVKLERLSGDVVTDAFNLGDTMDQFFSTIDEDNLKTVLAKGTYDAGDDYDYTQEIKLGSLELTHFEDDDLSTTDDKPVIGFELTNDNHILNYSLDFTDAVDGGTDFQEIADTDLPLLGRTYYVAKVDHDTENITKITLLDSANSDTISEGEKKTITVGDTSYDVELYLVTDDNKGADNLDGARFKVNGVTTDKVYQGDTKKVGPDLYIGIKSVDFNPKDTGTSTAEFSLGTGKIDLINHEEVEINGDKVSDIEKFNDAVLTSDIQTSGTDLTKIVLSWDLGEDSWLVPGRELVMPGFETIKLSMGAFNVPMKEMTQFSNDGKDKIELSTEVKDGHVSFDVLNFGSDDKIAGLGDDATHRLVTSAGNNIHVDTDLHDKFVATYTSGDDQESYVFKVDSVNDDGTTTKVKLHNEASGGGTTEIKNGDSQDFGRVTLAVANASDATNSADITITSAHSNYNTLVTKAGLLISLPINASVVGKTNVTLQLFDEDKDDKVAEGGLFNITLSTNDKGDAEVSDVTIPGSTLLDTDSNTDKLEGYVIDDVATRVVHDTGPDQETADIEYHGGQVFADVYLAESGAVISSTASDTDTTTHTTGTTKVLGSVRVTDAEASSVSNKNLIVVGGSCINSVAANLLGGSLCGADFTAKTDVGAGQFLIQTFDRGSGNVATLIAGYETQETQNAAKYLTTNTVSTAVGSKYKGTSATTATMTTTSSTSSSAGSNATRSSNSSATNTTR